MGTLTAQSIITKAAIQLTDISYVRWTNPELLGWLNDGQRLIALMIPEASVVTANLPMVAGVKQTLPANGKLLLNVVRNTGASGLTAGKAVVRVPIEYMTRNNPNWPSDTATSSVTAYMYSPTDPTRFYIYPAADSSGNNVEISYSSIPTDITDTSTVISILDSYEPALLDYMLYRACSKDSEYAPGLQLAQKYLESFTAILTAAKGSQVTADAVKKG